MYIPLGIKSDYSLLSSLIKIEELIKYAKNNDLKALGINCPNCGSPITNLGKKTCSYCGTVVLEFIGRVFTCNDIVLHFHGLYSFFPILNYENP